MFSTVKHLVYLLHALDVLEALSRHEGEVPLSTLARELGAAKSGVYRILMTFESRGYVEQTHTGGWRLSSRVIELGARLPQRKLLTTAAPVLDEVTREVNESTYLSVLEGFSMMTLHTVEPPQTVRVHMPVGARTPANCTVSGLAMLGSMEKDALEAILPEQLEGTAPGSIVDRKRLVTELDVIRKRGYAISIGAWRPDTGGGAAVIRNSTGRVVGTFGISAPESRLTKERLIELGERAQRAASQISTSLGYVSSEATPTAAPAKRSMTSKKPLPSTANT